jgi:hypothetical protein
MLTVLQLYLNDSRSLTPSIMQDDNEVRQSGV